MDQTQKPRLLPGDIFVTTSTSYISRAILLAQTIWSKDNDAKYGHAGIITSVKGDTFEALRKITSSHLASYYGEQIMIARPMMTCSRRTLSVAEKELACRAVKDEYDGKTYPWWRLGLHLLGPIWPKYVGTGDWVVCSELVARYLKILDVYRGTYLGIAPDDLAEWMRNWWSIMVTYEGPWLWKE